MVKEMSNKQVTNEVTKQKFTFPPDTNYPQGFVVEAETHEQALDEYNKGIKKTNK